tara:strand:- start:78 stop:461 length:384 start_codon:yes stop_codon:yes gene_type:complete
MLVQMETLVQMVVAVEEAVVETVAPLETVEMVVVLVPEVVAVEKEAVEQIMVLVEVERMEVPTFLHFLLLHFTLVCRADRVAVDMEPETTTEAARHRARLVQEPQDNLHLNLEWAMVQGVRVVVALQ